MREFEAHITEFGSAGLQRENRVRGSNELLRLENLIPFRGKVVPVNEWESIAPVTTWPWPQLIRARGENLLATPTRLYKENGNILTDVVSNHHFHVADYETYAVMTNGQHTLEWRPSGVISIDPPHIPSCRCLCDFKGQLVLGGTAGFLSLGEDSVAWSKIGRVDFTLDHTNEAGARPVPFAGKVLFVKRLGNTVMVYGEKGVVSLFPVKEPVVSFGMQEVLPFGVVAVGGTESVHYFVSAKGELWRLSTEGAPEKLGYQKYLAPLLGGPITINMALLDQEVWISGITESYVLTLDGLGHSRQRVSSIHWEDVVADNSFGNYALVTSDFDLGLRASKSLTSIHLAGEFQGPASLTIGYRNNSGDYREVPARTIGPAGIVTFPVDGVDFRLHIFSSYPFDLERITLRWKLTDKRAIRGVYGQ